MGDLILETLDNFCHAFDRSIILYCNGNKWGALEYIEASLGFVGSRVEYLFQWFHEAS